MSDTSFSLKSGLLRRLLPVVVVFVLVGVVARFLGNGDGWEWLLLWAEGNRTWGALLIVLATMAGCLLGLSGFPLTLGCGFLFGFPKGFAVMMVGTALGTVTAFVVGRTMARGTLERKFAGRARLSALREAVGQRGFVIVFLSRLSPFSPYNILTYIFSLTRISFRKFFAGSILGNLPVTALYVYAGTLMKSIADVAARRVIDGGISPSFLLLAGGLTLVAALFLAWIARKEIGALSAGSSPEEREGEDLSIHR